MDTLDTLTAATPRSSLETEECFVPLPCDDMLPVDLPESFDLGARGYEGGFSWSWSSSPEWALLGAY